MTALRRWISRRPGRVILVVALAVLLAGVAASRLALVTDLVALMPEGSPEAEDYRRFLELFGGFEKVFVLVVPRTAPDVASGAAPSVDEGQLLEAAEVLGERLAASPEVAAVRSGLEAEDEAFFRRFLVRRSLLFVDEDTLADLGERLSPAAVERRGGELRALLRSPTGGLQASFVRDDPFGFAADLPQLASAGELPIDPVTGAFRALEGDAALLILTPAGGELDPDGGRRLLETLTEAFAELGAEWPALEGRAIGGPLYAAQDEMAIRGDMEKTVAGSVIGCAAILLLAFGGPWVPTASVLVLGAAFAFTGGALALGVGELTAVAFGFAAVLVGLGMDYAIHGATRFRQARQDGASPVLALERCFADAGPGILTSALTTAAAFATLGVAHSRPLRELGLVVATGILSILVASIVLGSALLVVRPATTAPGRLWRGLDGAVGRLVAVAERRPRAVLALGVAASAAALVGATALRLEPDLAAMRPANHPVFETERLLVERFGLGIDTATVVVEGADLDQVLERSAAVEELLERRAPGASATSPSDWMLAAPAARQRLDALSRLGLGEAATALEASLAASNLAPGAFASGLDALRAFAAGRDPGAPALEEWPAALAELVRRTPRGYAAAVRVRLPDGAWPAGPPPEVLAELETVAPGAAVASVPRLGGALKRVASQDLRRLAGLGLLLVTLVVGISFRGNLLASSLAMVPVALGTLWALGLWALLGRPLDLLSLSVVPILLGIGIDDGLHAVHGTAHGDAGGRRAFLTRHLGRSVRHAGLAMALTTLTTCVGFGSLAFSSIPGLARGGLLVPIGVLCCLLATLLVLPALGAVRGPRIDEPTAGQAPAGGTAR